jgi:8-oxo-dGTP pyrophosphatase MutT (NUDIX family)
MTNTSALRLAATCIPIRERSDTGLEVLMVRRNPNLSFGGLWTFPGGVLEPDDGAVPADIDEDRQHWGAPSLLSTAANGAVRETVEETALECDVSSLAWFSHWIPPLVGPPKRFATWFFLAPEHRGEIEVDPAENDQARWITAEAALEESTAGEFPLAAPTWITLDDLMAFDAVPQLVDHTITQGARLHHTKAIAGDGVRIVCWEGDAAYESEIADTDGPRNRAVLGNNMQIVERIRS